MRNSEKGSTRKMLLRAIHLDDSAQFRSILDSEGWPTDSAWSDYELLKHAIKHNHRRITHLLLDKGARVTKNCQRLNTPLHFAATKKTIGWPRVIARLLSQGASVDCKNSKSETALHVAFNSQAPDEIIDMLLQAHLSKSSVNLFNKDCLGFVHIACTRPNLDVVKRLVEAQEDLVNYQVSLKSGTIHAGYTTLHFAVDHGRLEIAEFLLRHGADIYKQNVNGSTALHLALELRNIEMVDLILSYDKSKRNKVNNFGVSHFMAACAGSNESLVNNYFSSLSSTSALLSSQVHEVVHYPISGYSALHFAAEFGRQRTVKLLLSKGADCCLLTINNVTPHVLAHKGNHDKIVRLLDKQCRTYRSITEAPKVLGERYEKIIEEDEQGDVMIRFKKREHTNSSSDDDSVGSDNDIARFSHKDLLPLFVNENNSNAENQCDSRFNYDFIENLENSEIRDGVSENAGRVVSGSEAFDLAQLSAQNLHFYHAGEDDYAEISKPSEELVGDGTKDSNVEQVPFNFAFPSCDAQIKVPTVIDQFSTPIQNQFSFLNATAPVFMPNVSVPSQNVYFVATPRMNSNPLNLVQVPVQEIHSVPSSSTSQSYFVLNADSGVSFNNSYFTNPGVADNSHNNFVNDHNGFYHDNLLDCMEPHASQSFEQTDYSSYVPSVNSNPIDNGPGKPNSFNQAVDINNNQFVSINRNVSFYSADNFP